MTNLNSVKNQLEQQVLDWKPDAAPSKLEIKFTREVIQGNEPLSDLLLRSAELFIYANAYDADIAGTLVQKARKALISRKFDDLLIANFLLTELTSMWAETDAVLPFALEILECGNEDVLEHLLFPCTITIGRASIRLNSDELRKKLFEKAKYFHDNKMSEYSNQCAVGFCLATNLDSTKCFDATFDQIRCL